MNRVGLMVFASFAVSLVPAKGIGSASERSLPPSGLSCEFRKSEFQNPKVPAKLKELVLMAKGGSGSQIELEIRNQSGQVIAQTQSPSFIQYETITIQGPSELHQPTFGMAAQVSFYSVRGSNQWSAIVKPFRFEVSPNQSFIAIYDCVVQP